MRDTWIIALIVAAAVAVGGLLYLYGGPAFHQTSITGTEKTSYTIVAQGPYAAGIDAQVNYRITNEEQFASLWRMIYSDNGPSLPSIDFSQHEILAIFGGSHSTGGYGVRVHDIQDVDGRRLIDIVYISPGESCVPTTQNTSPFILVQVEKTTLPLTHIKEQEVTTCR